MGCLFRGPDNALPPQWDHMPIGYNGRASSVVVSGTPVHRPMGQVAGPAGPEWTASRRLDLELELGAIIEAAALWHPASPDQAEDMIFGHILLNDWSAQYPGVGVSAPRAVPGKAFATTISPWIVTRAALGRSAAPVPPGRWTPCPICATAAGLS